MKFLAEDQLQAFLGHLAGETSVVAPVNQDGVVLFRPWQPGTKVELEVLLARQSPKEFVFRQSETYLRYSYRMEGVAAAGGDGSEPVRQTLTVEPVEEARAQVIFGLRPCDARGFVQMDNVFGGYGGFYFDPYYNAWREATSLVVVACTRPRSTCFCTTVGGGPAATEGADLLLTPVEGGFTVEAVTAEGEKLASLPGLADATEAQTAAADAAKEQAVAQVDVGFPLDGVREALEANFEDTRWQELSARCVSCGTCTYVCPSCYCFNITDESVEGQGERLRSWDSCFNPIYTLETSGHNPRDAKAARFRNRFSHKFWYYPDKYDSLLCSGCGRCTMSCPTRIDVREVIRTMSAPSVANAAGAASGEEG